MWALFASNQIISHKLFEWLKFIELFMGMVLGAVEDERCFFICMHKKIILWKISHFLKNEIMDTKEVLEGSIVVATF